MENLPQSYLLNCVGFAEIKQRFFFLENLTFIFITKWYLNCFQKRLSKDMDLQRNRFNCKLFG